MKLITHDISNHACLLSKFIRDSSLETSIDINVFQKSWFQFLTVLSSWYVICTGCTTTDGWTWTHSGQVIDSIMVVKNANVVK